MYLYSFIIYFTFLIVKFWTLTILHYLVKEIKIRKKCVVVFFFLIKRSWFPYTLLELLYKPPTTDSQQTKYDCGLGKVKNTLHKLYLASWH